jgi:replicative DNA helicase
MDYLGKIPPQAVDLEEVILGALLIEGSCFNEVSEYIQPETFYKDNHQHIYRAISELAEKNEPIDLLTVSEKLKQNGLLDEIGGYYYIATLTEKIASASHVETHAKIIAEKYIRRELIRIAHDLTKSSFDDEIEINDILSTFEAEKAQLFSFTKKEEKHISTCIDEMREHSLKINRDEVPKGIPTGFTYYDNFSGGIQRGDLVIIGGETSNGKTTLALNMAKNSARTGTKVGIISYEMTLFQLTARLVAHDQRISSKDIIRGNIDEKEFNLINNNVARLSETEIYLIKPTGTNFNRLVTDIIRMVEIYGLEMVVIDYLQLVSNPKRNSSKSDMVGEMSNRLKSLAVELNIGIVLLSQLARDRVKPRPTLSRLKESGDIENAADTVIFTYLPFKYGNSVDVINGENIEIGEDAIAIVAKGRNIGTTEFRLRFVKEIPAFFNYHKDDLPSDFYEPAEMTTPFD